MLMYILVYLLLAYTTAADTVSIVTISMEHCVVMQSSSLIAPHIKSLGQYNCIIQSHTWSVLVPDNLQTMTC